MTRLADLVPEFIAIKTIFMKGVQTKLVKMVLSARPVPGISSGSMSAPEVTQLIRKRLTEEQAQLK